MLSAIPFRTELSLLVRQPLSVNVLYRRKGSEKKLLLFRNEFVQAVNLGLYLQSLAECMYEIC